MQFHEAAAALARTCSGVVAPAMIEPDAGRRGERADRELVQRVPALFRERRERLDAVEPLVRDLASFEARALGRGLAAPVFPVSRPLASGKYGMYETPSSRRAGARRRRLALEEAVLVLQDA